MKIELNIDYFQEDGAIVAISPDLQVSSFGETVEEAEQSIGEALELYFEGCELQGSLSEVLEESGYRLVNGTWVPRSPLKTTRTTLLRTA